MGGVVVLIRLIAVKIWVCQNLFHLTWPCTTNKKLFPFTNSSTNRERCFTSLIENWTQRQTTPAGHKKRRMLTILEASRKRTRFTQRAARVSKLEPVPEEHLVVRSNNFIAPRMVQRTSLFHALITVLFLYFCSVRWTSIWQIKHLIRFRCTGTSVTSLQIKDERVWISLLALA